MGFLVNKKDFKKSQIFLFDLILSTVILIVSIGLILSFFTSQNQNQNIYDLSQNILNGLTQTKINTINSNEVRTMFINNEIQNIQNTVAQQIGSFYYAGKYQLAKNLTQDFLSTYVASQYNIQIILQNSSVSNYMLYENLPLNTLAIQNSTTSTQVSRVVFGFYNATTYYGPFTLIVRIWQ